MKINILTDNTPDLTRPELNSEHGLSLLIEHNGLRVLCDMGLGSNFMGNANLMKVDLQNLDFAFVSHGHKDHSGGLMTFLKCNGTAPVYLSPDIFHQQFFTSRHKEKRDISTDPNILNTFTDRLKWVSNSCWITPDIAIIKCDTHQWPCPLGNVFLTAKAEGNVEKADDFSHELSLAFKTDQGLVIVSSCSHNGALNIIQSAKNFTQESLIRAFIGGLHFVDCNRTAEEVDVFQQEWNRLYPETLLMTGHCTSDKAKEALKPYIRHLRIFRTGLQMEL